MISSPCANVCLMDPERAVCRGCRRTLDEIARWYDMPDEERRAVLEALPGRAPRRAAWHFDFVSPYSYLALHRLAELPPEVAIEYRPVLFAGLLERFGQKGPAEVAEKRRWTYRFCAWRAAELGVPFRFPAAHPFNPLPYLRLAIAAYPTAGVVRRIFEALWTTGADPADPAVLSSLLKELKVPGEQLSDLRVKEELKKNTAQAAERGVFGVPSLEIDGEVFWGEDATGFARAFLERPEALRNDETRRLDALPVGASRRA